jgi:NAD(P)-dependent dehydrogenase (short-subunit alcohol dehydrogenase family)
MKAGLRHPNAHATHAAARPLWANLNIMEPRMPPDPVTTKMDAIQQQVRDADRARPREEMKGAMQAGARRYPEPPFPTEAQDKPGLEDSQSLAPMYEAPFWKGSGKLEGKVAIITGADSGIGRAVAILFAREGADIAIMHLEHEQGDADTVRAKVEAEGRRAITIAGDVTDREFCFAAAKRTVDELGRLDVLVNNAAFQLHVSRFEDLTEDHFDLTVKTNLYGYFHMTQACLPHMVEGSAIVNSGSVTGLLGNSTIIDYTMTKGGIHAFTRALSGSLAARGIRVNAVAPGPVWTPLNPSDNPTHMSEFGAETRMKRPAQPEEIAPAYLFLASPMMSGYITGEILPVIGGYTDR